MKAVFSAAQLAHDPKRFFSWGNVVNHPEHPERARRLLAGARKVGADILATRSFERSHLEKIHTPRYLDFLETGHRVWSRHEGANREVLPSQRPSMAPPYNYPSNIMGRAGWHMQDLSVPLVENSWRAIKASADTALTAAGLILGGQRAAYALCRPPGHHALRERAGGFCFLANTAIATQHLRDKFERVAVLDVDVHHGNGTERIFYKRNDVLTVSIHADPNEFYPYYYGVEADRGAKAGEGYNVNIPVPIGSNDAVWLGAVDHALEAIAKYDPGVLVVALGLDAHIDDPLKGGAMSTEGFGYMSRLIVKLGKPTLMVQEGGYLTPRLGDNLAEFLGGFM